eukprot:1194479-Prorocentrum_minimum.AAC.2
MQTPLSTLGRHVENAGDNTFRDLDDVAGALGRVDEDLHETPPDIRPQNPPDPLLHSHSAVTLLLAECPSDPAFRPLRTPFCTATPQPLLAESPGPGGDAPESGRDDHRLAAGICISQPACQRGGGQPRHTGSPLKRPQ